MAVQYSFGKIVTDGLVLALDAADRNSYVSGSTTWFDVSGNNNSGSLINGPTFNTGSGGSIVFDGVDDYGYLILPSLNFDTSGITLGFWFKQVNEVGAWRTTINLKNNLNNNFLEIRNTDGNGLMAGNYFDVVANTDTRTATFNALENIWYYLTVCWGNNNLTFYANGNSIGSTSLPSINLGTSPQVRLAIAYSDNRNVNCHIANTQIYNRALSATEVLQNYNAQKSRFGLT